MAFNTEIIFKNTATSFHASEAYNLARILLMPLDFYTFPVDILQSRRLSMVK